MLDNADDDESPGREERVGEEWTARGGSLPVRFGLLFRSFRSGSFRFGSFRRPTTTSTNFRNNAF